MTTPARPEDSPARANTAPDTELPTLPHEHAEGTFVSLPPAPSAPTLSYNPILPPPVELSGRFGRYEIIRSLGKGGMGRVYLALDTQLDRRVALKVPQLEGGDRTTLCERFYREARAAANLHHPNICPVHDVGCIDDIPFLTMTYIEGQTLQEWAAATRPHPSVVLRLLARVALALEEAHQHQVIHRDLKPSNVMIDRRGEPVVMDFGLARRLSLPDEDRLTTPGLLVGTPAYMAPESVYGEAAPSPAMDVYSLGVMLYELLAGRPPFVGPALDLLAQVLRDTPAPPSRWRAGLDPAVDAVCLRALARRPADRFASMTDFARTLTSLAGQNLASPSGGAAGGETPPDPALAPRILDLLRTWGWARAVQKMRNRAQRADRPEQRAAYQGFLDWMAGERSQDAAAVAAFQGLPGGQALRGWALVGQASHRQRDREYAAAIKLLDRAAAEGDPADAMLQATIAHTLAANLVHTGQSDAALPRLHRALELFGPDHFMAGRVLDTLGMAYAYKGNFPIARSFYQESIRRKQVCNDEAGIAISHGQLGRLYLDWGHLDEAEGHFQEDLRLVQKLRSRWSEAQLYNHLGQVALARGDREVACGRRSTARRHYQAAAGWLEQSIRLCQEGSFAVSEAFARKDRALGYLAEGDLAAAQEQARLAAELFAANSFYEGTAKVQVVEGMILRQQGRTAEAERRFRQALNYFETTREADEAVRTLREIARTLRDGNAPVPLVTRAYLEALQRAEAVRHDHLVRGIEEELHEVDVEAYLRHIYRRIRGTAIDDDTPSLLCGESQFGTILSIDLPGFTQTCQGLPAEEVLLTFNHLIADLTDVLTRQDVRILAYRGNGLLALAREARHAERAVAAARELAAALVEFNRPRALLGLEGFRLRIGVATGDLLLGNVGTYHKIDFTAVGSAVTRAGLLRAFASDDLPCIDRSTCEAVRGRLRFHPDSPRQVMGDDGVVHEAWDVLPEDVAPPSPSGQRLPKL